MSLSAVDLYPERTDRRVSERLFSAWWKENCPALWTVVNVDHILPAAGWEGEEDVWAVSHFGDALLLVETALDTGQASKTCTVTASLAKGVRYRRAYCVLVTPASDDATIAGFRYLRLWPEPDSEFRVVTGEQLVVAFTNARDWCIATRDGQ